ncbi:unconventional myosin-XIX-like [Palaemon carinicauda]|uniref:unconventional myosin-XIX-like n=1 Tax=Palaemon carinicauda TaxID=392227 RepID=UPI0035B5D2AE
MEKNYNTAGPKPCQNKVPPPVPKKKHKGTTGAAPISSEEVDDTKSPNNALQVSIEELIFCEDLTRLPLLYDHTVLQCILKRYLNSLFYTWAGPTLVACNPCRPVGYLYSFDQIKHHYDQIQSGTDRRDAHVYNVAGLAHHRLIHHLGSVNQAVLVSGESGAGKTESARYMLGYLTHIEVSYSSVPRSPLKGVWKDKEPQDIQERILASNPILEAFGNAATMRNHNSSRFGKLIRLQYGGRQLRGAEIDTYLLEKTRITCQPDKERNFHIFYQLLAVMKTKKVEGLLINERDTFVIAPGDVTQNDLNNFENTLLAFQHLKFSIDHQMQIFKIIAALLHLGNITFAEDDATHSVWTVNTKSKECDRSLEAACELLGLEREDLISTLTIHTISVGTARKVSVFHKPCEREAQCTERRDALMQLIYYSLFLHIVSYINKQISAERNLWSNFLGILDVYGFETFEQNSLEQLCINYTNERLQQEFIRRYLATEHQVLKEEGFLGVDIKYTDNSRCVLALDSPVSVFAILNEECQLKRAVKEDEACDRVCKALQNSGIVSPPVSPRHTPGFVIRHYAGPVKYDADGLLHKNKDEVPLEVTGLLAASNEDFVGNLITYTTDMNLDTASGRRTTRKITTLSKFKASLDNLMKTLSACDLHYVRCIKPNPYSLTGEPNDQYLMEQLKACGVIETVSISQAGYPARISYEEFVVRYGEHTEDFVTAAQEIAKEVLATPDGNIDLAKCRLGRSRIFLSESALHTLELVREAKRNNAATCLQKYWRMHCCVQRYKTVRSAILVLQNQGKAWLARQKFIRWRNSCVVIQKNTRKIIAAKRYKSIYHAVVIVQKYCRGWIARKKYRALLQQNTSRPYSRQSVVSMNSLGYFSLTTSNSIHSLNPSLHDVSPMGASFCDFGSIGYNEALRGYISPEHQQRLLETEESGIETDTESINGDDDKTEKRKSSKSRRKAKLRRLLEAKGNSSFVQTASEESPDDSIGNHVSQSSGVESSGCQPDSLSRMKYGGKNNVGNLSRASYTSNVLCGNPDPDEKVKTAADPIDKSFAPKVRVATMHNLRDLSTLLKDYSPNENLQMVLPKQNLSLFFKDGVLSYRRMPVVGIKFHTRPTCLPFSHNLPYHERPHGLLDILH